MANLSIAAPTVEKPASLFIEILRDASRPKDLVLGVFAGASLPSAAEKTSRRAVLIDPRPDQCDEAVSHWQKLTNKTAVHLKGGAMPRPALPLSAGQP
jgi:DNA modification methylase